MAAVLGKVKVPGAEIAPTGPPLEKMVDDHFEPIRRLVAGTPPPMDEIMKMFNEVYVQLAAIDAAQKSKSAPPPAGGAERVKAAAGSCPSRRARPSRRSPARPRPRARRSSARA
jgi:type VI secretion system protein ImpL